MQETLIIIFISMTNLNTRPESIIPLGISHTIHYGEKVEYRIGSGIEKYFSQRVY